MDFISKSDARYTYGHAYHSHYASPLAIRERKYEIGVLRAMGMKKGKVAMGLLAEQIAIAFVK